MSGLDFLTVIEELGLSIAPNSALKWREWAVSEGVTLPTEFLDSLYSGANELLTHYSNDEMMQPPATLSEWQGVQVMPLLQENQGNFMFGLLLGSVTPAPVLVAYGSRTPYWQNFAPDFITFDWARLLDFQYLFSNFTEDKEWFFEDLPYTLATEAALAAAFRRGPTTPDCYNGGRGVRHRFYRAGQHVAVNVRGDRQPYWEISAVSVELFQQLQAEIRRLRP